MAPGGLGGVGYGQGGEAVEVHQHEGDKVHDQVQGGGGTRDVAPGGDGGVGAGRGGHDQHRAGPGEGQGGRVQEEEGGEAGDVHHQHGGNLEIQTSSRPTFHTSSSKKPKPMYFKKKRGIIPDGLVQMRLSQFRKDFPNLKANLSSISSSTNSKSKQYSNINVGESAGGISTNQGRAATQRDLQLTNQEQILRSGGKRKVESQLLKCKKRQENTDFGGSKTDQT